jgi:hypothetical protein
MNLEQSQKDKLVEEMWTATPEVVQHYVGRDFDPQKITQKMLDDTRNNTPASCVEMLYRRLKKRLTGPDVGHA